MLEQEIDFGPGYSIYFGRDGKKVILHAGGTKVRQSEDIETAGERWADYKRRTKKRKDCEPWR